MGDDDDDVSSSVLFDIEEKLKSSKYEKNFVREMLGSDLTVSYMQKEGFNNPIIVKSKEGLGLNVPVVTVKDIRGFVRNFAASKKSLFLYQRRFLNLGWVTS